MASSSLENVLSGTAKMKGSTLVETFQLLYLPPVHALRGHHAIKDSRDN